MFIVEQHVHIQPPRTAWSVAANAVSTSYREHSVT